jgi:hypothetical protein
MSGSESILWTDEVSLSSSLKSLLSSLDQSLSLSCSIGWGFGRVETGAGTSRGAWSRIGNVSGGPPVDWANPYQALVVASVWEYVRESICSIPAVSRMLFVRIAEYASIIGLGELGRDQ